MIDPVDTLSTLPEPYEILDLAPSQSAQIVPVRWEMGKMFMTPRDGRAAKDIPVLRIHVDRKDKPSAPFWWDITSKRAIAGLLGYLAAPNPGRYRFTIFKDGAGPSARFPIEATPLA